MKKKFTDIKLSILSIEGNGFHLFMPAKIGHKQIKVLLDTGASRSVFDYSYVVNELPKLSIEKIPVATHGVVSGDITTFYTIFKTLRLGEIRIKDYEAVLVDLTHLKTTLNQFFSLQISGIIGGDILTKYEALIDYGSQNLRLYY